MKLYNSTPPTRPIRSKLHNNTIILCPSQQNPKVKPFYSTTHQHTTAKRIQFFSTILTRPFIKKQPILSSTKHTLSFPPPFFASHKHYIMQPLLANACSLERTSHEKPVPAAPPKPISFHSDCACFSAINIPN